MQVKLTDGSMREISLEEAKRIHDEINRVAPAKQHYGTETPEEYHMRAYENIQRIGSKMNIMHIKDDEPEMKDLISHILGVSEEKADMLGEIIEWFIAAHDMKVRA
jgi:hypothetical protein